jgi:hypothetical protein
VVILNTDLPESLDENLANQKILEILDTLSESANWPPVGDIEIQYIPTHGFLGERSNEEDLVLMSEEIVRDLSSKLQELRQIMTDNQVGAWLSFKMDISGQTGGYNIAFDFDNIPQDFEGKNVSVDLLIADMKLNPRSKTSIPGWATALLA